MTDTQCEDNLFELEYDENYINRFSEKVKELILKISILKLKDWNVKKHL